MNHYALSFALFIMAFFAEPVLGNTVRYELVVRQQNVNLSGKQSVDFALTVNGSIPGPILTFTEGDNAEIVVKNEIADQDLSIHWHGILLPPEMDGVPYVNTPPIKPGTSFSFKFPIRQNGTYWYHSHTGVQEQKGVYGAIVINPKVPTIKADHDVVAVLSDWSDENANQILKNLRKDGDYYLYKKNTVRSWWGAFQAGATKTYLDNEWTRMGGMDLSDVGYDAFLINGRHDLQLLDANPGDTVRLRLINAAASTYFHVALGDQTMKVIAADGLPIVPIDAKELLMGMAEVYDVLFKVPALRNYELKATAQDGSGSTSGWVGKGAKVPAPIRPLPDMYASMDHTAAGHGEGNDHSMGHSKTEPSSQDHSHMDHGTMNHGTMDHGAMGHAAKTAVVDSVTVDHLRAPARTSLPENAPVRELKLILSGDMSRYVWHINGKAIHEDRTISVSKGDVVRFIFENETMMHHPMHLHGHFFRVLNDGGEFSPLKHTVDVPPHESRTIEFYADEPGEWMLHCHNLYHMKTGMARVVKYLSYQPSEEIAALQKKDPHRHDHWYGYGFMEAATNLLHGRFRLSQTWNELEASFEARQDQKWEPEGDVFYRRWFSQYTNLILGASGHEKEAVAVVGLGYLLPLMIKSEVLVDHKGKLRLDLEKHFQWTATWFSEIEAEFHSERKPQYKVSLLYGPQWAWAAGIVATEGSAGLGARVQF